MMGPDSVRWLYATESEIVSMCENQVLELGRPSGRPFERKWIYKETDMDVGIHRSSTCRKKEFPTKFKELTTMRLGSLVVMLKFVRIDSSNRYIFQL